jgi:hypothetical protein
MSRLAVHFEAGQGRALLWCSELATTRPAASAFSATPNSRGDFHAAAFNARSCPLGSAPRSESTCAPRRWTTMEGMSTRSR